MSSEQLGSGCPDALAVTSGGSIYATGATGGGGYSVHRVEVDGQVSSVVPMNAVAVTLNDLGDNGPAALARCIWTPPDAPAEGRMRRLYDTPRRPERPPGSRTISIQ